MPQLAADACQQQAQRPVTGDEVHQKAADQAGHNGFAHVQRDDAQGVFRAVGAVEIGQSRVAAAVGADVVPDDEVGHHHRAVEAAQQIPQQQHDGRHQISQQHKAVLIASKAGHPSSSPFCRMVMIMGVPSNPNTLRIWFSRYRR